MPLLMAPVIRTNVDFQIEIVPADGIRLPFSGSGDLGTSPFFGQLSVRTIRLTVRQRTTVPAYKIRPARKSLPEQIGRFWPSASFSSFGEFGIGHYLLHFGAPGKPRSKHVPSRSTGGFTSMIFASVGAIMVVSTGRIRVCPFIPRHQKAMGTAVSLR
jgi:hypothetical protein